MPRNGRRGSDPGQVPVLVPPARLAGHDHTLRPPTRLSYADASAPCSAFVHPASRHAGFQVRPSGASRIDAVARLYPGRGDTALVDETASHAPPGGSGTGRSRRSRMSNGASDHPGYGCRTRSSVITLGLQPFLLGQAPGPISRPNGWVTGIWPFDGSTLWRTRVAARRRRFRRCSSQPPVPAASLAEHLTLLYDKYDGTGRVVTHATGLGRQAVFMGTATFLGLRCLVVASARHHAGGALRRLCSGSGDGGR